MTHPNLIERLKSCPFCGGKAEQHGPDLVWAVDFAECDECGANVPVSVWNTRTNDQTISTLTAVLRDAREAIASLDEDALGECVTSYDRHGNPEGWSLRDELLAKIDATLTKGSGS